jgi:tRNA(Ile)-lysidine synthase
VTTGDLLERVRATGLLLPGGSVVVLLSGGRDSVCLLDVAVRLAGPESVSALHVNYGLRDAAAGDEAHCRALCDRLGVALDVHLAARPEDAGGNLQAWARDVRLGAGAQLAIARGARLATGHTASDQAETVLYRLAASPGRRALLGMSERDGLLVRPLLRVTRDETAAHCVSRGLTWREDASNDDPAYARNRARAGLVPALRELHPAAEANVVRTAELLRDEAAVLDEVVDTALAGRDRIAVTHLAALPPALARLVLRRLAEGAAGRLCARAAARLDEVLALGDGALDLGDGARAVVTEGVLRVDPTPPGRSAPAGTPAGQPRSQS